MVALLSLLTLTAGLPDTLLYNGRAGELQVDPPRFESPAITVDGRLDEPEWERAAVLEGFTQYTPVEGREATQETEVRVFYASDAIYFGIYARDSEPDKILVNLTERDRSSFGNDWIRLMIDTFDDQRQAYALFTNPFGIQTDGIWLESIQPLGGPTGPKVDFSPDFIWDSDGRVVDDGWIVEIRVPFVSIRFPDAEVQNWGLQIARGVTRSDFKSSWAPLTLDISSVLSQSGRLVGLRGLRPKRLVELNPVATAKLEGERTDATFSRGSVEPEIGLNARYGITPNLVLDATLNPDFSQVEADVDQIQVNERFALFFPERRPFFLDGAEVFASTQRLVHTRRVVDPIAGAKLTGKIGNLGVAYLGAIDQSPGSVFGGGENALFNLVRVRRDVGAGSTLGLFYTDRTLTGGEEYNRVVSTDLRLLFKERYSLEAQLTGSWTAAGAPNEDVRMEPLATVQLARTGRHFTYRAKLEDSRPGFRTSSGFIPRVGNTEVALATGLTGYGAPGADLERFAAEVRWNSFFVHDEFWDGQSPFEWEIELWPMLAFRGARTFTGIARWGGHRFRPEDFAAHSVVGQDGEEAPYPLPVELDGMFGFGLIPNIRVNEALQLTGTYFYREVPLFDEGGKGLEFRAAPGFAIQPNEKWKIDLSYTWSRLWREDESVFSNVRLTRARVQYQFGRSVFARVIAQYDLEDRSPLRHPLTGQPVSIGGVLQEARERGTFEGQALLSYEPSPGRIFFIGYSRLMEGRADYGLGGKDPQLDGFFVKISYLFRL